MTTESDLKRTIKAALRGMTWNADLVPNDDGHMPGDIITSARAKVSAPQRAQWRMKTIGNSRNSRVVIDSEDQENIYLALRKSGVFTRKGEYCAVLETTPGKPWVTQRMSNIEIWFLVQRRTPLRPKKSFFLDVLYDPYMQRRFCRP